MLFERQPERNCIVGFDLRDDFCQMSWCVLGKGQEAPEPVTWSAVPGEERFNIPTVLCRENGANRWQFGTAAAARLSDPGVTYVPHLLSQAVEGAGVAIGDEVYDAEALLSRFINQCLKDLSAELPQGVPVSIMFTAPQMDSRTIGMLENVRKRLNLRGEVWYQSHGGSYYDFMLHEERGLREPGTALFEYEDGGSLRVTRLHFNVNSRPIVAYQDESEYPGLQSQSDAGRDEEFSRLVRSELAGRNYASVYLIGSGFRSGWMKKSVSVLCAGGRRAFLGGNLFSKGAAYGAIYRMQPPPILSDYFFLDRNKLRTNVLIRALVHGSEETVTLLEAGVNWYEAHGTAELILDGTGELNLLLKPLTGGEEKPFHIRLEGLPVREGRITRVRLTFSMRSADKLVILIEDLGFGDTFPTSGLKWEQTITLQG